MAEPVSQLLELSKPFPPELVKPAPQGKFGSYVAHSTVTERLLSAVGPFSFGVMELIRESDGQVTGCLAELTVTVDGRTVTIREVGEVEHHERHTDGSAAKNAASDALKRCAMRLGLGLHLWSERDYFLNKQLEKQAHDETA